MLCDIWTKHLAVISMALAFAAFLSGAPTDPNYVNSRSAYTVQLKGMVRDEYGCHLPGGDVYYPCPPMAPGRSLDRNETHTVPVYTWPASKVLSRSGGVPIKYNVNYLVNETFRENKTTLARIHRTLRSIEIAIGCIKFHELTSQPSEGTPYMHYTFVRPGCNSGIGLNPTGELIVNLEEYGCHYMTQITHETLHALGMHHEHIRADRDQYLQFDWGNIKPEMRPNFDLNPDYKLGQYDMHSIMHYSPTAFAIDRNKPTISSKQSWNKPVYWNRGGCKKDVTWNGTKCASYVSQGDKLKLRQLYPC